jgi:hypothetical protein
MTKAEQREAAEVLRWVVERIDRGEVDAAAWYRERLVAAMLALDPSRPSRVKDYGVSDSLASR